MSSDLVDQLHTELQRMQQEFHTECERMQQVQQQQHVQLRDELQNLQREVLSLRPSLLESQSQTRSRPHRPKPSLPDPDRFSGQAYKFDTWLPSIKAKLRVDAEAIGGNIDQFYYVYLNLENSVQAMVLPQLDDAEERQVWNYQTILDQLSRIYDNPNKFQEAEDKLHNLKQGNESISAYIAKFERLLYAARGQDWPDSVKITTFRNGLGSTARQRLNLQLNLPRDYPSFIRTVQQLSSHVSAPANTHGPDQMDTSVGNINVIDPVLASLEQPQSSQSNSHPKSLHARSISPSRRQQYRDNNQCVRCGSHDHWVAECPLQPSVSSRPRRQMAKRIPAPDSDDGLDQDPDSDGWRSDYEALTRGSL